MARRKKGTTEKRQERAAQVRAEQEERFRTKERSEIAARREHSERQASLARLQEQERADADRLAGRKAPEKLAETEQRIREARAEHEKATRGQHEQNEAEREDMESQVDRSNAEERERVLQMRKAGRKQLQLEYENKAQGLRTGPPVLGGSDPEGSTPPADPKPDTRNADEDDGA